MTRRPRTEAACLTLALIGLALGAVVVSPLLAVGWVLKQMEGRKDA